MATRFLNKGFVPEATGNAVGFGADEDGVIRGNVSGTAGDTFAVPGWRIKTVTASVTATAADNGTLFIADSTTSVVVSLPATAKGLTFGLVVLQLTTVGGHAFSPVAVDSIAGNGFTVADNKDAICSAASDRVGDMLVLIGDGVNGWYISTVTGTWAREA